MQVEPFGIKAPHLWQVERIDVGFDDADVEPALGLEVDPGEEPAGGQSRDDAGQQPARRVA